MSKASAVITSSLPTYPASPCHLAQPSCPATQPSPASSACQLPDAWKLSRSWEQAVCRVGCGATRGTGRACLQGRLWSDPGNRQGLFAGSVVERPWGGKLASWLGWLRCWIRWLSLVAGLGGWGDWPGCLGDEMFLNSVYATF